MLSHEFADEIAALVRSLEGEVRQHPELTFSDDMDLLQALDQALVALVAVRLKVKASLDRG